MSGIETNRLAVKHKPFTIMPLRAREIFRKVVRGSRTKFFDGAMATSAALNYKKSELMHMRRATASV